MSTVTRPTQVEEAWLECQVDKGMFSDELAVTYPSQGAWQKSVFVDRHAVKGEIGTVGKVRVAILRKDDSIMAVLPSPEQDIVYVAPGDLSQ